MHPATSAMHDSTPPARPLLGYFVAGSLLLHALLAGLWQDRAPAGPSARSTFQVTLLARHGDTAGKVQGAGQAVLSEPPATTSVASAPAPVQTGHRQVQPAAKTGQVARLHTVTRAPGHTKEHRDADTRDKPSTATIKKTGSRTRQAQATARDGASSHSQHELSIAARYRKTRRALLEALLPHFDYPPLARRRGWQGRVNVGLHVAADGDLTRIRLVQSSGYALLDRAAVRNVTELRGIPRAAQWLEGNGMDLVLPVRYQLAD